ncbi:MAG TPA: hypothetical protein VFD56_13430 [Chitinophagaceae bacterium]|nr:hypothetical protein [Chitinophagaceae bacterium]
MQKRTIIGTLILIIAIAGSFLVFQSSAQTDSRSEGAKESPSPKKEKDSKMIWENLSHQFFSPA